MSVAYLTKNEKEHVRKLLVLTFGNQAKKKVGNKQ